MAHMNVVQVPGEKSVDHATDVEKDGASFTVLAISQEDWHYSHKWTRRLLKWGLETRGEQKHFLRCNVRVY